MERFIRFVVHQKVGDESRRVGLFTAAYHLLSTGDLRRDDLRTLEEILAWFQTELVVPPNGAIPSQAIFWYRDERPFTGRMWELAQVLREYDYTVELVTARFVGRVVYLDDHQVAAVPRKGRPR